MDQVSDHEPETPYFNNVPQEFERNFKLKFFQIVVVLIAVLLLVLYFTKQ